MKIACISLGCPKNQVDLDAMVHILLSAGHETVADLAEADVILVNTCGFIESAKTEAIENILEACSYKQQNPELKVIVTGCLAERYRSQIEEEIPEVDAVVGCASNKAIDTIVARLFHGEDHLESYGAKKDFPLGGKRVIGTPAHYAYLKIAEGCNNRCHYCAIPGIRGLNIWHDIDSSRIKPEDFMVVIEIPKGSKAKYELDKQTGILKLDRILHTSTHYPANYGFIPRTYADDMDPLDVLVLCSEQIYPMTLIRCYPIGVITMLDNGHNDEKIIAIPYSDPTYNEYKDISELPKHIFDEMTHFFSVYKSLENKETVVDEVKGRESAIEIIGQTIESYKEKFTQI